VKAAVLHGRNDLRVETISDPQPGSADVVVDVAACGICGSDLPRFAGTGIYHYPIICGHETGGTVSAVGPGVAANLRGQRVSVIPLIPCGTCRYCQARMPFHCAKYDFIGSRRDGGFAERLLVPASNVVGVPPSLTDAAMAMTEPAAVACHCVRAAQVSTGDVVLVFGGGAIGNFIAQWAKLAGAGRVILADLRPRSLAIAAQCGLETCDAGADPVGVIRQLTDGRGADVVVEAAGAAAATTAAFDAVRRKGTVALIGRINGDYLLPAATLTNILRKEIAIQGVWGFDHWRQPHNDWRLACDALAAGRLVVEPLITHRFSLSEIGRAIQMMTSGREFYCKVLVMPQEEA